MKIAMATVLLAALGVAGAARSELTMEKVAAGERSNIAVALEVVVRTEAEWQQLWNEHAPRQPIPKVDFAARMIVGVFLGTRPTSGFGVQIVEVGELQDALRVKYTERAPAPGAMVTQVLTSPFALVSVPARSVEVRFEQVVARPHPFRRRSPVAVERP